MKQLFLIAAMLMCIVVVNAQDVIDEFNVGPYEVNYSGPGDVNYRLKEGVDLYEYYGLKKDTIISAPEPELVKHGFQLSFLGEASMSRHNHSLVFGLEGVWKQRIAKKTYFNGGVSLGYAASAQSNIDKDILEAGVPISIEWANLYSKKASLYFAIKVSPTYYMSLSKKSDNGLTIQHQGLYVSPGIDLGGYIPMGSHFAKIGVTCRYKINCYPQDSDIYQGTFGRAFVGANLGIFF